jgi:hypothetical protein
MNLITRRRGSHGRHTVLVVVAIMLAALSAVAGVADAAPEAKDPDARGTKLVTSFFDLLKDGDVEGMERFLSPAFQLQGADGGFLDKDEFIADPPELESYELSGLRATRSGKVIIVRYDVQAVVTIDGKPQSRDPAPRLSVFAKGKNGWQIVAHANFNVPEADAPQQ